MERGKIKDLVNSSGGERIETILMVLCIIAVKGLKGYASMGFCITYLELVSRKHCL
jgi:hypothetical protein